MPRELSLRGRILDAIADRMRNIVDNVNISFDEVNSVLNNFRFAIDGTYSQEKPRRFLFEVVDELKLKYIEKDVDSEPDENYVPPTETEVIFTKGVPFSISDTSVTLSIDFDTPANVGDTFLVIFNNCWKTIRDVRRYPRVNSNRPTEGISVYPLEEDKVKQVSDRYQNELWVCIEVFIEGEVESSFRDLEEVVADIEDEINRNRVFDKCLNYESETSKIRIFDSESTSEFVGAQIFTLVKYRNDIRKASKQRN
jgi:hypothetical protein